MLLGALASMVHGGVAEVLERVPFEDPDLERALDLPRGTLTRARLSPLELPLEHSRRLGEYLARYVLEGRTAAEFTDVCAYLDPGAKVSPRAPGHTSRPGGDDGKLDLPDQGIRLTVRCPRCGALYMLGSSHPLLLILTDLHDEGGHPLALAYYTGNTVRCPAASAGSCLAEASAWAPRPVRLHANADALEALSPGGLLCPL